MLSYFLVDAVRRLVNMTAFLKTAQTPQQFHPTNNPNQQFVPVLTIFT
jgi:hypothetical protein